LPQWTRNDHAFGDTVISIYMGTTLRLRVVKALLPVPARRLRWSLMRLRRTHWPRRICMMKPHGLGNASDMCRFPPCP
jgi:hypothetical protein